MPTNKSSRQSKNLRTNQLRSLLAATSAGSSTRQKRRNQRRRQRKALRSRALKSLPDRIEAGVPDIYRGIGAGAGGIWKGIRTLFNFKSMEPQSAVAAIPASYQTVLCNQSYDGPERPCRHPTLGLDGIMFEGSQFFCTLRQPVAATAGMWPVLPGSFPGSYFSIDTLTAPSGLATNGFFVNPWNFGSKIAFRSFQYQRFRFNMLRLRFVSTNGVQQTGSLAVGYYKDAVTGQAQCTLGEVYFPQIADLVPSLVTPMNVAQAAIVIPYDGPELYYCGITGGRPPPIGTYPAELRQEDQGFIVLSMDSNTTLPMAPTVMNVYLDYQIELYDPSPVVDSVPGTLSELQLVRNMLAEVRGSGLRKSIGRRVTDCDPFAHEMFDYLKRFPQRGSRKKTVTVIEEEKE